MGRDYSRIGGQGVRGGRGWTGIASRSMGSRISIRYTNQQVANFSLAKASQILQSSAYWSNIHTSR